MTTESSSFPTDFERDEEGHAMVGTQRLDDVRSRLAGWHFSQEAMERQAVEVLHYAETLMKELDRRHGGYAR